MVRVSLERVGRGVVAAIGLAALGGCSTIQVKLGARVDLPKLPVTAMVASQYKTPGVGPGEKKSLIVTFTQPDGTVLVTAGKGKGKVQWKDISVVATVVSVNKSGVLSLPADPRLSDGKTGHVTITVPSHPDLKAELDIPLRYNYAFRASYSGSDGTRGSDGTAGLDGTSGSMARTIRTILSRAATAPMEPMARTAATAAMATTDRRCRCGSRCRQGVLRCCSSESGPQGNRSGSTWSIRRAAR
jgi:hypothetical protein